MTPQQYVNELIRKFVPHADTHRIPLYRAKKCALICVDEIIANIQGEKIEWYLEVKRILETM